MSDKRPGNSQGLSRWALARKRLRDKTAAMTLFRKKRKKENQARALGESGRLQQMKVQGEQQRDLLEREGEKMVETYDLDKQDKMLEFALARKESVDASVDAQNAAIDKFVGGAAQVGLKAITGGVL